MLDRWQRRRLELLDIVEPLVWEYALSLQILETLRIERAVHRCELTKTGLVLVRYKLDKSIQ